MKKTLISAITLFSLATTVTFAQGVYSKPFDNHRPGQPQAQAPRFNNNDQFQDDLKIDQLDAMVNLSRKQEKDLQKIENSYDRLLANPRQSLDTKRQLQLRKRQDMLAVLTSAQRDRLFAYQSQPNNRYNKNQPSAPFGRRG
ncbi:hypothetical protein GO755_08410 [Spirosoma sp. HMF4905]|uniref:Periplasmic heavy metal sensor n=1 Tax=Spirosoma arboris TaxID=2682092 RepID=A0A7K1S898_9BACT|nr:hypothetical protein [Spirosoma arboris]MVM30052.1 hypothetical protein [Spirosoma arboris]